MCIYIGHDGTMGTCMEDTLVWRRSEDILKKLISRSPCSSRLPTMKTEAFLIHMRLYQLLKDLWILGLQLSFVISSVNIAYT